MDISKQLGLTELQESAYNEFNNLGSKYNMEKSAVLMYIDFYNNKQKKYLRQPKGMDLGKWIDLPKIVVPKSQSIIDRITGWLMQGSIVESTNYSYLTSAPSFKYFLEDYLTTGLVEGTTYIRVDYKDGLMEPTIYSIKNSLMLYSGKVPIIFYAQYDYSEYVLGGLHTVTTIEMITDLGIRKIKYFMDAAKMYILSDENVPNPYQEINVTPVLFHRKPLTMYGRSFLDGIAELNLELDELYSGVSRILQYHAAPVLVIKGASGSKVNLAVDRILYVGKDADATYLTWNQDTKAYDNQINKIEGLISEKSGIPDCVLTAEIPSGLSSLSLKVLYTPVETLMIAMKTIWEDRLNETMEFMSKLNPDNKPNDVVFNFNKDVIPENYLSSMDDLIKGQDNSIISKEDAKKKLEGEIANE